MALYERYVNRTEFKDYDDFKKNFKINVPETFNYAYDVVDVLAEEKPNERALVWCDDTGEERIFTYKDIMEYTNRTANFLTRIGIKKGDKVMLILKRHYQFWYTLMALHKIGAAAVPATHLLTPKDIVYRNNQASVKCIICTSDHDFANNVDAALPESPTLELRVFAGGHGTKERKGWLDLDKEIMKESAVFEKRTGDLAPKPNDAMLLYFTSGTSGQPKMVKHDFLYPLGHIITVCFWHHAVEGGLHLTVAETGWAKAVWGKLYGQWLAGTAIFVYDMDKFVPKNLLEKMEKYKLTTFCAPPTIYRFMIKEDLSQYDLSSLRELAVAGEALNPEVYYQMLKATGIRMRECYGQTEVISLVCTFPWMEPKPGSMGKPAACYDVDIIDDQGRHCFPGEVGEIVINTKNGKPVGMFDGYYRNKELTEKAWHDGYYHTGDLAYMDETGYYWYVGRADDVIKSSGYKIGPFEVESALMEHPAVLECAITGVPDDLRGQVVKATIVLAKGYTPSEELVKELQNHVKKVTAPYKYPRVVEFVDELPKTISGKIRRVQIREQDKKG